VLAVKSFNTKILNIHILVKRIRNYIVMNSIDTIEVIPFSTRTCKYYINGGERHLCNYDKLRKMLFDSSPTLVYDIIYYLDRKMSFLLDVKNKKIYEIKPDEAIVEAQMREEVFYLKNPVVEIEVDKHQIKGVKYLQNLQNKVLNYNKRRNEDEQHHK